MKDCNTSKFPADQQRDTSNPAQGGSRTGSNMGKDYSRQQQQGNRPASEQTRRNPSETDRNR